MSLDIRLPIGGMFGLLGLLLLVYGFVTRGDDMYASSLHYNVNLIWGAVMLIFGGVMLGFGLRKKPASPAGDDTPRRASH